MLPSRMFFDNFFERENNNELMKCDIYKTGENYILEIDIPGFKKEDIDIEYDNDYLTVKVEKKEFDEDDVEKEYIKKERSMYEQYERSFYIGSIDENKIKAKFENGILKLNIPKVQEELTRKKIEIE